MHGVSRKTDTRYGYGNVMMHASKLQVPLCGCELYKGERALWIQCGAQNTGVLPVEVSHGSQMQGVKAIKMVVKSAWLHGILLILPGSRPGEW